MKNAITLAGIEASIDIGSQHIRVASKDHDPAYLMTPEGYAGVQTFALVALANKINESGHVRWRTFTYQVDVPTDLALACSAEWLGNRDDTYRCDSPDGHDGPHTFTLDAGTLRWSGGPDA